MKLTDILYLANRGLHVFPMPKHSKVPFAGFLWKAEASNLAWKIKEWWEHYSATMDPEDLNWGINCGLSNLIVIDIDNKNGKNGSEELLRLELEYSELPYAFTVQTPTGGFHIYLLGLAGCSVDKIAKGIDVKSVGGYVLTPGSHVVENKPDSPKVDGPYTIVSDFDDRNLLESPSAPDWLLNKLNLAWERTHDNQTPLTEQDKEVYLERTIDYLRGTTKLALKGAGGDITAFSIACDCRDFGCSQPVTEQLMLQYYYPRCTPNNNPNFIVQKIENAYSYGQSAPGSKTGEAQFDVVPGFEDDEQGNPPPLPQRKSIWDLSNTTYDYGQLYQNEYPPEICFLDPWMKKPSMGIIYGGFGIGKTWFVLSLIEKIEKKEAFGPWDFKNYGRTAYIDGEMTAASMQKRFEQVGLTDDGVGWIYNNTELMISGLPPANIMLEEWQQEVQEQLVARKIDIVVFDNLSSLTIGGDENTQSEWSIINLWGIRLRAMGITAIFVHHTGKSGEQRGTHSRFDQMDWAIKLQRPKDYQEIQGARFNVLFRKKRVDNEDISKLVDIQMRLMQFRPDISDTRVIPNSGGKTYQPLKSVWEFTKPKDAGKEQVRAAMVRGSNTKELMSLFNLSKSAISNIRVKMKAEGHLDDKGIATAKGIEAYTWCEDED